MRLSVSNIALTPYDHAGELAALAGMGFTGLEAAPSRRWRDTGAVTGADAAAYRREIEDASLVCVGLHSLFFDHPALGLFKERGARAETLDFLVHLSGVCRDLGGKTLIWGGGRRRGAVPPAQAQAESIDFLGEYARRTAGHGTCLCFEPLGPDDSDFINSVHDSIAIVKAVNHKAVRVQVDLKAMIQNNELTETAVQAARPWLVHAHANESDLGVLGASGETNHHARFGEFLRGAGYEGFVSLEQKQINPADSLGPIAESAAVMQKAYG